MPAKKKASKSTSDESVTCSNQGEDGQLTGVFSSDFPLLCTQNELPVIAVRNIAGDPTELPQGCYYWVWIKSDDPTIKKLGELNIRGWKIIPPVIKCLTLSLQSHIVTNIVIWETGLESECLSLLCDLLPQLQIRSLEIGGSPLSDLIPVSKLLENCKSLYELRLRCCELTDEILKPVCLSLKGDLSLKQLDLSHNKIGDESVRLLAHALRINRSLLVLSLNDNKIGDLGAIYLAEVLREFKLNHEEIVQRRKIFSQQHQHKWAEIRTGLSRQSSSMGPRSSSRDKSDTKKLGAVLKATSFIRKTKKSVEAKKAVAKGKGSEGKTTPESSTSRPVLSAAKKLHGPLMDDVKEEGAKTLHGPLVDDIKEGVHVLSPGNLTLISLSLNYNQISSSGLQSLLQTIQYQSEKLKEREMRKGIEQSTGTGLLAVNLQHNLFSLEDTAHQTMQEILTSKAPSITEQSTTTDELNVTEK